VNITAAADADVQQLRSTTFVRVTGGGSSRTMGGRKEKEKKIPKIKTKT